MVRIPTALSLVFVTIAVFVGALGNGWVLIDDPVYVTENAHVIHGLTRDAVLHFLRSSHGGNWHPLTSLSHLLDVTLFGLSPIGPHAINVALHALNALLLLLVLRKLTGSWWRSLAVAGLFALHPLRVESVAWISERKDVLSGAFFLLTLLAWQRWTERPSAGRYTTTCVLLALGLASKPMLVSLPALLLVLDVWPLQRLPLQRNSLHDGTLAERLREKWALFAIALVFVVITFLVQRGTGAMTDGGALPLATRAGNALLSVWRYVGRSLWPVDLGVFYPYALPLAAPWVAASALGVLLVSWFVWRERASRPYLMAGWLWFVGMLLPVIGLVQVGRQSWADRYSYLPTIGLAIALVWSLAPLARRSNILRAAIVVALIAACAALGNASMRQVTRWKDSETLFVWTSRVVPDNTTALMGLGNAYMKQGRAADAVEPFEQALKIAPADSEVRDRMVIVLMQLGRHEDALTVTLDGLKLRQTAYGWFHVGTLSAQLGRDSVACEAFARSAKLEPHREQTRSQWGEALVRLGRTREALEQFDESLRIEPANPTVLLQSAWIRATSADARLRDGAKALEQAKFVSDATHGSDALAEATYAAACAATGRWAEAISTGERAVVLAREAGSRAEAALYAAQLARYRDRQALRER